MPNAAERLLADIRKLAPEITERAAEIEAARTVPADLIEKLRAIGLFRMLVPHSHGGLELRLPEAVEVVAALARIDGSVGWTVMICCGGQVAGPLLPMETYELIYGESPDVIPAGSIVPAGTAEKVPGGWRVKGRWPFASGCQHSEWLLGMCVMMEGGKPILTAQGIPMVRGVVLPAADWEIEDTWHAAGLKGTGSHHIAIKDKIVPENHFLDLWAGTPCVQGPLYDAPVHLLPLLHGAFSVGMAEGTLGDLIALAGTGRQQMRAAQPMRESELFQYELGRIAANARAARAYLQMQTGSHWRHALAGTLKDEARGAEGTQAAVWLVTTCVGVADACFTLAGGAAVYESSPLQRRLRDLHAAAQHAVAHQRHYAGVGKMLLNGGISAH